MKERIKWYEKHPVSAERKAELVGKGYAIIDAKFKPADYENPAENDDGADVGGKLSVAELKSALEAKGIEIPAGAKKADLRALLEASE
jgi:hypothetical protein